MGWPQHDGTQEESGGRIMGLAGGFSQHGLWLEFLFANGICFYRVYIIPASVGR
jgi:hypothetical protein